jgi:site-specific DNA-methyltransferase (adenine-specific)
MTATGVCEYRHGTSPDALADLPDGCAAAVVTDPPYGTETANTIYGRRRESGETRLIRNDRDLSALESTASTFARVLAPAGVALVYCAPTLRRAVENAVEAGGLMPIHNVPWDKGAPGISYRVRYAYEDCVLAVHGEYDPFELRGPLVVPIRVPREQEPEHPHEKPVALLRRLIQWACPQGGLVVDPFAGIASCGVAALAERCSYIGVECDPRWWPIAERRLADARNLPHPELPPSLFTDVA